MKTGLYIGKLASVVMILACVSCYSESDNGERTLPGKIAYNYARENLNKHTDILAMTYQFSLMMAEETMQGRDSINNRYFNQVKITSATDPVTRQPVYRLRSIPRQYAGDVRYDLLVTGAGEHPILNIPGTSWQVQATTASYGDTIFYHLTITCTADQTWKITEHTSTPKSLYYMGGGDDDACSYNSSFSCRNEEWTVEWSNSPYDLTCSLRLKGEMESVATPKMRMTYQSAGDIQCVYVGDDYYQKQVAGIWMIPVSEEIRNYPFLTYWQQGELRLMVDDVIGGTQDDIKVTLTDYNVILDDSGVQERWRFW